MTPTRFLRLSVALIGALALAACTQTSAGTPLPDDTTTHSGEPETTVPTTGGTPTNERPRDINLDGKDPCTLISQADWPQFGIDQPGKPSEDATFQSPRCFYAGVGDLVLVVTGGIEAWEEQAQNVDVSETKAIDEFRTLTIWNEADRRSCYTAVDVADGQHLLTTAASTKANVDREESCERSYRLAESAMKTLVAS